MSNFFEGKSGFINTPRVDGKTTPNQGGLTENATLDGQGCGENRGKTGGVDGNPRGYDPVTTVGASVNPPEKGGVNPSTLPQNGKNFRQPSLPSADFSVNPPIFSSTLPKNRGDFRQPWIALTYFPVDTTPLETRIRQLSERALKSAEVIPFDLVDPNRPAGFWLEQSLKALAIQNELDVLLEHHHLGMPYSRAAWKTIRLFPVMSNRLALIFLDRVNLYRLHWGEQSVQVHEGGRVLRFANCPFVIAV